MGTDKKIDISFGKKIRILWYTIKAKRAMNKFTKSVTRLSDSSLAASEAFKKLAAVLGKPVDQVKLSTTVSVPDEQDGNDE